MVHRIGALVGACVILVACLATPSEVRAAVGLESVVTGLTKPTFVTHAPDGSDRLFILEQEGVIKVLQPGSTVPTVFLNLKSAVSSQGERGLLGLAFHPSFATNRRFFVCYTKQNGGAVAVAEYKVSATNPNVALKPRRVLLSIPHNQFTNHNGGWIGFGLDGFLYITVGDGGFRNDPNSNGQNIETLLGKVLRIDVDRTAGGKRYAIPPDNPFVGVAGLDEIFAYGFRNPWRGAIDRVTGVLHVGDVGQGAHEEIDVVTKGGNYGWRVFEGNQCTQLDPDQCDDAGFTAPIHTYPNAGARCAVTGGYVYRGTAGTFAAGTYVFGDFCSGEIFVRQGGVVNTLLDTDLLISSFGEDADGEIYVVDHDGAVHRLVTVP
jgi:glucose/arabinose dehydrogenase